MHFHENDIFIPIRKIIVGDPIKGMAFVVGQHLAGCVVVSIERNPSNSKQFFVYAKSDDGVIRAWKEILNQPVFIEFDFKAEGY
jgi:hypothetical protein